MAKTKPTKVAKPKTTPPIKPETKNSKTREDLESLSAAARSPGTFSTTEIGHVAGDVWGLLVRDDSLTVAAIKKSIDAPPDLVLAAIGWLAREDKLEFSTQSRSVKVSLR
jgi:hypothetical protein